MFASLGKAFAVESKQGILFCFLEGCPFMAPFHVDEVADFVRYQGFYLVVGVPLFFGYVFQSKEYGWLPVVRGCPSGAAADADIND